MTKWHLDPKDAVGLTFYSLKDGSRLWATGFSTPDGKIELVGRVEMKRRKERLEPR